MFKRLFTIRKPFSERERFSAFISNLVGSHPRNVDIYHQALVHKSANEKQRNGRETNERLEYLGDAVLGAIIASELYKKYPQKDEGFLTKTRSKIVSRASLNSIGQKLGIEPFIIAQTSISLNKTHILGDAVEAIIGAIYLDKGFDAAKKFISDKIIGDHINIDTLSTDEDNHKSLLIEFCQRNKLEVTFETEEHPLNQKGIYEFISVVIVNMEVCGHGVGISKKESQQMASKEALLYLKNKITSVDNKK